MNVRNIESPRSGRPVSNQYEITTESGTLFQSYESAIALIDSHGVVHVSSRWDYSNTTGKYRNQFLGETMQETRRKIESGEYKTDLDYKTGTVGVDWSK